MNEFLCVYSISVWVCSPAWSHSSTENHYPPERWRQTANEWTHQGRLQFISAFLFQSRHLLDPNSWRWWYLAALFQTHVLIRVCVCVCVFVPVWALSRRVFLCVWAVRRIVALLAADEALCFKSRLPTQCRATVTAQIASLIHTADAPITHQPFLFHSWLPAIWLFI